MRDETILILGYEEWGIWRQTHDLAHLLARDNIVIFVEPSVPYERLRWRGENTTNYIQLFRPQPLRRIDDNLIVAFSPPMLPVAVPLLSRFHRKKIMRCSLRLSKALKGMLLRRQLRRARLLPTVLFIYHPLDLLMAGRFDERISCWRVYDEVSRFNGWDGYAGDLIQETEKNGIRRVDLVFASSQAQFEKRKALHPDTYFVPNAVSFELFQRALREDFPQPEDIKNIPRPRLGYVGMMDRSVDFELLKEIATRRPEWSLVIIGVPRGDEQQQEAAALESLPNVYIAGFKPHLEVPVCLKWCDVGLIPYRHTPDKMAAYPTKLHEYLAMGLPVVSTAVPEVRPRDGVIYTANGPQEFVLRIEEALSKNSLEQVEARRAMARENSWEERLKFMNSLIGQRLDGMVSKPC